jgi:pilus assembly protein TadC
MAAESTMFENAGRLFFSRERVKAMEKDLNISGVNIAADSFAGYLALNISVISIFLTALILLYQPIMQPILGFLKKYVVDVPFPVFALIALILSLLSVYFTVMMLLSSYFVMKADNRRSRLETALPDFLILVSSNIKAGMTLDQAMWYSAKPEFGLLSTEVKSHIKSSFSGESLESTMDKLASRFDSRVFKRTIMLLKQASATGGELTNVLEKTADDVRNTQIMKKEIAASLVLYEIFVLFAAIVGTPFLFAVAVKLVTVFEKVGPQVSGAGGMGTAGGVFGLVSNVKFSGPVISSSDFYWFSVATIFVTSVISSFIVSAIRTGGRGQGMKYFPFILITSYIFYGLVLSTVDAFFASMV